MAGEIKNTLTLDVSRFSSALEKAVSGTLGLEKQLKSAAKVAADFDKGVTGVGNDLAGIAKNFRLLDQSVESMVSRLTGLVSGFDRLGQHSEKAASGVERLGSAVKKTTSVNADQWIKRYSMELDKLAPALKRTISSIIDFDRANIAAGNSAEKSADKTVAAKLKSLESEREGNRRIIAEREKLAAELQTIQDTMQKRADANTAVASNYKGRNKDHPTAVMYRGEAATAQGAAATAATELAALESVMREMKWKNSEIEKTIALLRQEEAAALKAAQAEKAANTSAADSKRMAKEASRAAAEAAEESTKAARLAANERMRLARETAAFEKQQAHDVAQMWKSMGQLWAASKVQTGLGQVAQKSAGMQDTQLRVQAWGIRGNELKEFNEKAFDLARQESYLSNLDAIQGRFTAITSLGYNNVGVVDATLGDSLRTVQALKSLGYENGNTTDVQRNLYGIAETRQVMNDPEAINKTFDTAFRLGNVSGGKITLADLETVLRNLGPGANQISDRGLMNITALAEQAKVSGGHGSGGAGSGVSSVGVMVKMAQLYAMGKPISNTLLEQMAGAGLTAGDIESKEKLVGGKKEHMALLRSMKSGGLKNQQEIMDDPVTAMWKMRAPIMKYINSSGKSRALYYGDKDADINNEDAQMNALQKFWARSGLSNKAITQMVTAQDPRFYHRTKKVTESALSGDGAKETLDLAEKTNNWNLSVQKMKKGAEDLASSFDKVLEKLSFIPEAIGAILKKASSFVKDNPLLAAFDLAAVAAGGFMLAIKGAVGILGSVGGALNPIKVLMTGTSTAIGSAAGAMNTLRTGVLAAGIAFPSLATAIDTVLAAASKLLGPIVAPFAAVAGGASGALGWLGRLSGGILGFIAKWASPLGWAALAGQFGWVIGEWISSLKAGGITIGEHMQNVFLDIEMGWRKMLRGIEEKWIDFKKLVGGKDFLGESEQRAELEAKRAADREFDKNMRVVPAEPKAPSGVAPVKSTGGKSKEEKSSSELPDPKAVASMIAGPGRVAREFENSFQRSLAQMQGRENIDALKLGTILSKNPSYDDQAKEAFTAKWLGGDFDDGKDPTKRKFVKGGAQYDKQKGWSASDIDWNGQDQQTKKKISDWLEAYKAGKIYEDQIKAVTFASERQAAKDEEAATAIGRLTGNIYGQTDAMRALNKEFAREEARNPSAITDTDYQDRKQAALSKQAITDYANTGADLVQKNKQMEAQFFDNQRERLEHGANATLETKRREAQMVRDQLDQQIKDMEANGKECTQLYYDLIDAREKGEDEFTRYLKNIQEERDRAIRTPMQNMLAEWGDIYGQMEQMQSRWADQFMDSMSTVISGGKVDWRKFCLDMATDLSKVLLKKGVAGLLGGPEGVGDFSIAKMIGKLFDKKPIAPGVTAPGAPGAPVDAVPGMGGSLGGGLTPGAGGGLTPGAGAGAAASADAASESMKKVAESGEAAAAASQLNAVATEASTTVTAADNAIVEAGTVAKTAEVAETEVGTAVKAVSTAAEEQETVANISSMISEESEEIANIASAAAEYLANGGVADQSGLSFFANGGAFTNSLVDSPTLFKFANGGKFGVMGEAGPEAVMPLSRDGSGRLGVSLHGDGQAGGNTTTVGQQVSIQIVVNQGEKGNDEGGKASGDESGAWRKLADRVKSVVKEELTVQQRPGGLLYK